MKFIYPLGRGSKWQNNEIRISLNLLKKHFKGKTNIEIVIIGDSIPKDLHSLAEIVHFGDQTNKPQRNVITKLNHIQNITKDEFVLMNDDFFLLRETDTIPNYYSGLLSDKIKSMENVPSSYVAGMRKAMEMLIQKGIRDPRNHMIHAPYIVHDPKLFFSITKGILSQGRNCSLRQVYLGSKNDSMVEIPYDIKTQVPFATEHQFNEFTKHCPWFSISDRFLNNWGKKKLLSLSGE